MEKIKNMKKLAIIILAVITLAVVFSGQISAQGMHVEEVFETWGDPDDIGSDSMTYTIQTKTNHLMVVVFHYDKAGYIHKAVFIGYKFDIQISWLNQVGGDDSTIFYDTIKVERQGWSYTYMKLDRNNLCAVIIKDENYYNNYQQW